MQPGGGSGAGLLELFLELLNVTSVVIVCLVYAKDCVWGQALSCEECLFLDMLVWNVTVKPLHFNMQQEFPVFILLMLKMSRLQRKGMRSDREVRWGIVKLQLVRAWFPFFSILKEDVGYLNKSFEAFPKHVPSLKFLFEHPCGTSGTGVRACVKYPAWDLQEPGLSGWDLRNQSAWDAFFCVFVLVLWFFFFFFWKVKAWWICPHG